MTFSFKFIFFLSFLFDRFCSKALFGIIEGFYWPQSQSVNGSYGEFTHEDRRNLLNLQKKLGLSTYVYGPKELLGTNYDRAYNVSLLGDLHQWKQTFALSKSLNITFLWSLSGWLPTNAEDFEVVFQKILQLNFFIMI